MAKPAQYKHAVRVDNQGRLVPECSENNVVHWRGTPQDQEGRLAQAHALAQREIADHVTETGHTPFKQRHASRRRV